MRQVLVSCILTIALVFPTVRLSADSRPTLSGVAAGIELCPQFICGFALFIGQFQGEVNGRPASGGFSAVINHEPLQLPGQVALITDGRWTIATNRRVMRGDVLEGAILTINETQFCVSMVMDVTDGGRGQVYFTGLLDHGPFPPTIGGFVTQSPSPSPCPGSPAPLSLIPNP